MTKIKHPISKFERKRIDEKKQIQRDGQERRREQNIYKKLTIEHLKEKETEDELHLYKTSANITG